MNDFFKNVANSYHVDKPMMIEKMLLRMLPGNKMTGKIYVCVTRPRRFGKTLMISMLGAFFTKGRDTAESFKDLEIYKSPLFFDHVNKHNVFHIDFGILANQSTCCGEVIQRAAGAMADDILENWPDIEVMDAPYDLSKGVPKDQDDKSAEINAQIMETRLIAALNQAYERHNQMFIFLFDEWDAPFQKHWMDQNSKMIYLEFLRDLFKGAQYVEIAYMTGVLPIPSYSNVSALNMFDEYRLGDDPLYSEFFGFTSQEVKELHAKYAAQLNGQRKKVSLRALKSWYNGYRTDSGNIYNPLSVIRSLTNNKISSNWTASGKRTQVMDYVSLNFDNAKDDVKTLMLEQTPVELDNFAYDVEGVTSRDEILSMLVAVGLLTFIDGKVSIPNREVAKEYSKALKDPRFGYVSRLVRKSEELVKATLGMDAEGVARIIEDAHMDESPLLVYSNESELMHVVSSAYIYARDKYEIQRESNCGTDRSASRTSRKSPKPAISSGRVTCSPMHPGKGFCDLIFSPIIKSETAFVVELKADETDEAAVSQIKNKMYHRRFITDASYTGKILLVGIGYDKDEKTHKCVRSCLDIICRIINYRYMTIVNQLIYMLYG
jgi:hypothetical protein